LGEWRYLLIKLISNNKIQKQVFLNAFRTTLMQIFGEYGYIQVDPKVIDYDEENLEIILKCKKEKVHIVRASLLFLTEINNNPVMAYVAKASGTLKKLKTLKLLSSIKKG